MATESQLITEVLDNPDDDDPRLVYADWLDEQGDPRGEFIRVQCELHRSCPEDVNFNFLHRREPKIVEGVWQSMESSGVG